MDREAIDNTPFSSLLNVQNDLFEQEQQQLSSSPSSQKSQTSITSNTSGCLNRTPVRSKPIAIPQLAATKTPDNSLRSSPQVYSTSSDSYVFVELNAPFATDERELNSFFHGPSPTFMNNSSESGQDLNDVSQQLAELELSVPQIDSFVESVCLTKSQEENWTSQQS